MKRKATVTMDCSINIAIRAAEPSDAELLAQMGARTFVQAFAEHNTEENMAAYLAASFGPEIQASEIRDPGTLFLIASIEDQPAAYAKLDLSQPPECVEAVKPAEVARFYVEAEWHGRGVSHHLMGEVVRRARNSSADVLWLAVWEHNPRAIAFYQKWGFKYAGTKSFLLGSDLQSDHVLTRPVALG